MVDAVWDGVDFLGYARDCFGNNSSLACSAMAGAGLMTAIPGDGLGDNAARKAYLLGGGGMTDEALEQVFELSGKYHYLEVVDIDPFAVKELELRLKLQGGKPSNVRIRAMAASRLGTVSDADIFFVAPNPTWVASTLSDDFDKVVGVGSRGYIISDFQALGSYVNIHGSIVDELAAIDIFHDFSGNRSPIFRIQNATLPSGGIRIYSSYFGKNPEAYFMSLER